MIAGRQLSIGPLPVRSALLDYTIAAELKKFPIKGVYLLINKVNKYFIRVSPESALSSRSP